jgi:phosphatidylserine decarboxylase
MQTPLKVLIQYIAPQHLLTRMVRCLADCRWKWFKTWSIKRLIRVHHVDPSEALIEDLGAYPTFNSFFTRHLKPALRPIAHGANQIVSPADGSISQLGKIDADTILQAKNFNYSATTLLGGSEVIARSFYNGSFATIYLAPRNYHRVHMPFSGKLRQTIYIPGQLFSVNQLTAKTVPHLFTRNERLVCIFDTSMGPMAVVLVGAMLVGQIETVWPCDLQTKKISIKNYPESPTLEAGAELGHFKMGSTVIVLFAKNQMEWASQLQETVEVKMGQSIGLKIS